MGYLKRKGFTLLRSSNGRTYILQRDKSNQNLDSIDTTEIKKDIVELIYSNKYIKENFVYKIKTFEQYLENKKKIGKYNAGIELEKDFFEKRNDFKLKFNDFIYNLFNRSFITGTYSYHEVKDINIDIESKDFREIFADQGKCITIYLFEKGLNKNFLWVAKILDKAYKEKWNNKDIKRYIVDNFIKDKKKTPIKTLAQIGMKGLYKEKAMKRMLTDIKPSHGMNIRNFEALELFKELEYNQIENLIDEVISETCYDVGILCKNIVEGTNAEINRIRKKIRTNSNQPFIFKKKKLYFLLEIIKNHYVNRTNDITIYLDIKNNFGDKKKKLLVKYLHEYVKGRVRKLQTMGEVTTPDIKKVFNYETLRRKVKRYILQKINYHFETLGKKNLHFNNKSISSLDLERIKCIDTLLLKLNTAIAQAGYSIRTIFNGDRDFLGGENIVQELFRENKISINSNYLIQKMNCFFPNPYESNHVKFTNYKSFITELIDQKYLNNLVDVVYRLRLNCHHYKEKFNFQNLNIIKKEDISKPQIAEDNTNKLYIINELYKNLVNKDTISQTILEKFSSTNITKFYEKESILKVISHFKIMDMEAKNLIPTFNNIWNALIKKGDYSECKPLKNGIDLTEEQLQDFNFRLSEKNFLNIIYDRIYRNCNIENFSDSYNKVREMYSQKEQQKIQALGDKLQNKNGLNYWKLPKIYSNTAININTFLSDIQKMNSENENDLRFAMQQWCEIIAYNFSDYIKSNTGFMKKNILIDKDEIEKVETELKKEILELSNINPPTLNNDLKRSFFVLSFFIDNKELSNLRHDMAKYKQFMEDIDKRESALRKISKKTDEYLSEANIFDEVITIFSVMLDIKDRFDKISIPYNINSYFAELNKKIEENNIEVNNKGSLKSVSIKVEDEIKLVFTRLSGCSEELVIIIENAKYIYYEKKHNPPKKIDNLNEIKWIKNYASEIQDILHRCLPCFEKLFFFCNITNIRDIIYSEHYSNYRDEKNFIIYANIEKAIKYGRKDVVEKFIIKNTKYRISQQDFINIREINVLQESEKKKAFIDKVIEEKNILSEAEKEDLKKAHLNLLKYYNSESKVKMFRFEEITDFLMDIYSRLVSWTTIWERDMTYAIKERFGESRGDNQHNVKDLFKKLSEKNKETLYCLYFSEFENVVEENGYNFIDLCNIRNKIAHYEYFKNENIISLKQLCLNVYQMFSYSKRIQTDITNSIVKIFEKHGFSVEIKFIDNFNFDVINIKSLPQNISKSLGIELLRFEKEKGEMMLDFFNWQPNK